MGFPGVTKTQGRDFNYYQSLTVTWSTFGGGASDGYGCDMIITFPTYGVIFTNETSGAVVEYSFNGSTVHGVLDGTTTPTVSTTRIMKFLNRPIALIWFRATSGTPTITVTAWAER